jgi:vitamin B12 transporter
VRFGAEVIASSYRYDDAANTRRLGGYGILNLTAEWDVAKGWTLFARANNVFDHDYQLAADFSTGGATLFAGLRWRL